MNNLIYNIDAETKCEIAQNWITDGEFHFNGLTYKRGVDDVEAKKVLSKIMTIPIHELASNFEYLMSTKLSQGGTPAAGFSIGSGKKLYWFITPNPNTGLYRCLCLEDNGCLGWPRYITPETKITIHY